jgi:endonuclease/exonuclease/phosphatase (EEP) superfamily protein YafD
VRRFYPLVLLILTAIQRGWRCRRGFPALAAVFAPYLFAPLLLLAPAALRRDARLLRALLLTCALAYIRWFRPPRSKGPASRPPAGPIFSVMTWNFLFSRPQVEDIVRFLAASPAEVVALQELTAEHVHRIAGDPTLAQRFPYQILWPYRYGAGMALLSRYPILAQGKLEHPPTVWTRLELGGEQQITVVNAHPTFFPPRKIPDAAVSSLLTRIRRLLDPRLLRYDPEYRDRGIRHVRALVESLLIQDNALLAVGDFNVTEREPAYEELTAGLCDAQRCVGRGSGHTWRPEWLMGLPLPILRIDYMLSSPAIRPLRLSVDCAPRGSDHCILHGEFAIDHGGIKPSPFLAASNQMDGKPGRG